jgi:orotidine-5'-phosphate decarboxylase
MKSKECVYIALDGVTKQEALSLTKKLSASKYSHLIAGFKIHDLWDAYGPSIVKDLKRNGAKCVWLDLKLHDTPNTVLLRTNAVKKADGDMISVHAGVGARALKALTKINIKVVAITVLTSLDEKEIRSMYGTSSASAVKRLYEIAKNAGVWGIVCSAKEVRILPKGKIKPIVPGIKVNNTPDTNQKRIGTPKETLQNGADYIVIGSAITKSKNPLTTFEEIAKIL